MHSVDSVVICCFLAESLQQHWCAITIFLADGSRLTAAVPCNLDEVESVPTEITRFVS